MQFTENELSTLAGLVRRRLTYEKRRPVSGFTDEKIRHLNAILHKITKERRENGQPNLPVRTES